MSFGISINQPLLGTVAFANYKTGTRIFSEKPLFIIPSRSSLGKLEYHYAIQATVRALTNAECDELESLPNNFPRNYLSFGEGIIATNALPALPALPALLHEPADPNSATGEMTIHAIRDISVAEDITIAYKWDLPSMDRQEFLSRTFGFLQCDPMGSWSYAREKTTPDTITLKSLMGKVNRRQEYKALVMSVERENLLWGRSEGNDHGEVDRET